MSDPLRGEIWLCDLAPVRGHEQGERRPVLVMSTNAFNQGPADLVIVVPLTTTHRGIRSHVEIKPPEGGAKRASYILCEQVRCVAKERLIKLWGTVSAATLTAVELRLRILLEL